MNIKDIMSIVAAAVMAGGCSSDDGMQTREGRVPITLTASVGTSATTRGVQEELLIEDEKVYVWGKEGTGDYDYLKAWTLTADGSDGWKSGYTPKYYPLSGETLTMVALHGNFTYTEGTSDLTATISHSVEADQSATNAYEKSDLLWASETGSSTDAANKSFDFTHKLSKIEVKLHPGEGYADISSAEVMLRGILPTIAITPSDGTLGSASGSATLIKARKTEDHLSDATPYALYEAIIPPQDAPTNFLNIKIGDKLATVAADVASFGSNKRYVYDITITEFKVNVTSSIASWGYDAGGSQVNADVTNNKAVQIGRPKLPIEYVVGTHNMTDDTHMAADDDASNSAYFCWNASGSTTPKTNIQNMINGTAVPGYHLPSKAEWCSFFAPYYAQTTNMTDVSMGGDTAVRIVFKRGSSDNLSETVAWGVTNNNTSSTYSANNYAYDVNRVFYNDYNCPNDDEHKYIGYGLRFKELSGGKYVNGLYTCAYRYEYKSADSSVGGGASLTVQVKYVGFNQNITISTISAETWWAKPDFSVVLPACGHGSSTVHSDQSAGWASAENTECGYYWSATVRDATYLHSTFFNGSYVLGNNWAGPGEVRSVRLFHDAE